MILQAVRVFEATHARGIVVGEIECDSAAVQRLHAVGIASAQARPIYRTHVQRPHGVSVGLYVGDLVAAIDRAIVVEPRRHRSPPLINYRAPCTGADAVLEVVDPPVVARLAGVPETVVVQGKKRAVEAAVGADIGNAVVVTCAADEDPVSRDVGIGTDPLGGDIGPRALVVAVGLIHRLEVDQVIVSIPGRDRLPHGPVVRWIVDHACLGESFPIAQDHLETVCGSCVDGTSVGSPERSVHRGQINRQAHRIRVQIPLEPSDDRAGFCKSRKIIVRC